jgi:hypothetical protein
MEKPRFPLMLVVMVAFFGFIAVTAEARWIAIVAGIGAIFIAAAAIYQSIPRPPSDGELVDDEEDEPHS